MSRSVASDSLKPIDCSKPGSSVMGFPGQEYWSGLPYPIQGILLTQGILTCLSCVVGGFFITRATGRSSSNSEHGLFFGPYPWEVLNSVLALVSSGLKRWTTPLPPLPHHTHAQKKPSAFLRFSALISKPSVNSHPVASGQPVPPEENWQYQGPFLFSLLTRKLKSEVSDSGLCSPTACLFLSAGSDRLPGPSAPILNPGSAPRMGLWPPSLPSSRSSPFLQLCAFEPCCYSSSHLYQTGVLLSSVWLSVCSPSGSKELQAAHQPFPFWWAFISFSLFFPSSNNHSLCFSMYWCFHLYGMDSLGEISNLTPAYTLPHPSLSRPHPSSLTLLFASASAWFSPPTPCSPALLPPWSGPATQSSYLCPFYSLPCPKHLKQGIEYSMYSLEWTQSILEHWRIAF